MSFFRFLLALLIAAGIAFGLYLAVDKTRLDRVVEAVRTEVIDPVRARLAPDDAAEPETVEAEPAPIAEPEAEAEPDAEVADAAEPASEGTDGGIVETFAARTEEAIAEAGSVMEQVTNAAGDTIQGTVTAIEETLTGTTEEDTAASTEEAAAEPDAPATPTEDATAEAKTAAETGDEAETVQEAGTEAEAGSDMTIAPITPMPDTMEAVLPDDAQAPAALETQAALLPTTRIEASESVATDSTDALTVVSGGMSYAEARETMIASGWQPRIPALRAEVPDSTESALIEAGYAELEGCDESERPLCRFEFVDGQKRIAAVITRGTGTDPSVADAYLMNIRAE